MSDQKIPDHRFMEQTMRSADTTILYADGTTETVANANEACAKLTVDAEKPAVASKKSAKDEI